MFYIAYLELEIINYTEKCNLFFKPLELKNSNYNLETLLSS